MRNFGCENDMLPQTFIRGIVRVWQIFGHGYDFPTWSELGTKSKVKVTYFGGKKYLEEFKKYL